MNSRATTRGVFKAYVFFLIDHGMERVTSTSGIMKLENEFDKSSTITVYRKRVSMVSCWVMTLPEYG